MFYAVLAEVVYIAKLTNKYILLKYNCTGKFFGSNCCLYNKTVILLTLVVYSLRTSLTISSYTTRVRIITVKYTRSYYRKGSAAVRPTQLNSRYE